VKDIRSSLLVMLTVGLVGTWAYHLFDKTRYSKQRKEVFIKDSIAVAQGVQDSLQKIYSLTINDLDAKLDSSKNTQGLLKGELQAKLTEIYRLRSEIAGILKKNNVKKEDLDLARRKAIELQMLVHDLQNQNTTIEEEKQQITAMLDKVNVQVKSLETTNQQLDQQNKVLTEKVNQASAFFVSEVKLSPVTVKKDKEQETNSAEKTSKLVISFAVQNNIADYDNTEVYVVITQPDGKLLNDDVWESASTIDTKNEGRKRYTRKIKFEYQKGERKNLNFSINADEYQKGTYLLQLYHNGYMIGQSSKALG
jgi:chromosome segregation ATPase